MSASQEELTLITVESTYIAPSAEPFYKPYLRVVGVVGSNDQVMWSQEKFGHEDAAYDKGASNEQVIPASLEQKAKLLGFFAYQFASSSAPYMWNCHTFGSWMTHGEDWLKHDSPSTYHEMVNDGQKVKTLQEGQRGVIAAKFNLQPQPAHTVVGTAHEGNVIQVMADRGHLALTSLEDIMNYYDHPDTMIDGWSDFGLYAQPKGQASPADSKSTKQR